MLNLDVPSDGFDSTVDITDRVVWPKSDSAPMPVAVTLVAIGSTCSLSTMRYEPGAVRDLMEALERLAPADRTYQHEVVTGDPNGAAHLKAVLLGGCVTVPLQEDGHLALPELHRIVMLDFDPRSSIRTVLGFPHYQHGDPAVNVRH